MGDDSQSQSDAMISQQIQDQKAELEQKRKNLFEQRIAIIKSEGQQQWTSNKDASVTGQMPNGQTGAAGPQYRVHWFDRGQ